MKKETVRLDKFLSSNGVVSRRGVSELLSKQQVSINNVRVLDAGVRLIPKEDKVTINGQVVKNSEEYVHIILNKPKGVISTTSDEFNRETVTSLVKDGHRLYPVGRLDEDSTGLILLTNDGSLTHQLTHPRKHVPKVYKVLVSGVVSDKILNLLGSGVRLKEGMTAPAQIKILQRSKETTLLEFILHEGKHRQIRRMCAHVNLEVLELKRISIGPIQLENLQVGEWRYLSEEEINQLKNSN